ncbi:MBL fold metallo-hydrolase [Pseudarthrobacter sp. B4EP4b]|uniref:MBL fold metallo-hydrolase n=1 Tax=Pseudarthrobacter sp. B4EP4b TaxID=2590664 RepID=UPI00114F62BC|nr:MBL fold metallo-hydrolase [Pseudarthrobacter sp. B4EP4b]
MTAISVTGVLQQRAWKHNLLPPVEQVREHIWSIPVPFPGNPMRYTLSYLITGSGGAIIVDPGWRSETGLNHLGNGLHLAGIKAASVTGIVLTHYHPDHIGLAADVVRASGAWVALGKNEARPFLTDDSSDRRTARQTRLEHWGVPAAVRNQILDRADISRQFEILSNVGLSLGDGDRIPLDGRNIEVIETPGHTRGHICLHEAESGTFFSGDHVLPRISPHISLEPGQSANPLKDYFGSLDKITPYAAAEVLPGHEYRFRGLQHRTQQLHLHHEERAAEIQRVFDRHSPRTVWETARHLTWSRGWESLHGYALNFALAETAAHLAFLAAREADEGKTPRVYDSALYAINHA